MNQPYPQQGYPPQGGGYQGPGAPPPLPEGLQLSDHVGDLVWMKVNSYDPAYQGNWGTKPALHMDVEFLTGARDVGERTSDGVFSNVLLVKQLSMSVGSEVFGRIAAQPGKNANPAIYLGSPWPGDEQYVNAFLARQGQRPQQQQGLPQQQMAAYQQNGAQQGAQPPHQPYAQGYGQPQQAYPPQQQPPRTEYTQHDPNQPQQQPVGQGMPPASPPPGMGQYPQQPPF